MTIRIVTDSTCDLTDAQVAQYQISVLPLYINMDGKSYRDRVDISRKDFYDCLQKGGPLPTTASPGVDLFLNQYEALAADGATEILSIHISSKLSSMMDVASLAGKQFKSIPVTVHDSRQLSLGMGFIVLAAAQAAAAGAEMSEILKIVNEITARVYVFAALDTLEYLRRSGRMNFAMAGIGSLLSIKPLLKMYEGQPTTEQVRTTTRSLERLSSLLRELGPLERVAVVHSNTLEKSEQLIALNKPYLPSGEILSVDITPVLGAHLGPGAVGFACVKGR